MFRKCELGDRSGINEYDTKEHGRTTVEDGAYARRRREWKEIGDKL